MEKIFNFDDIVKYTKNNLDFVQDYFKLIHLQNILGIFLIFLLGLACGKGFSNSSARIFLGFFVIFFSYSFCSIANDIYDLEIDRINSPNRPLPSGRIEIGLAKRLALINALFTILCGIIGGATFVVCAILMLIIGISYSFPRFKRLSDKSFLGWGLLVFAYYILPYFLGFSSILNFKISNFLMLSGIACIGGAKLFLKDFRDEKGDKECKKITPLIMMGKRKLFLLIYALTVAGFIFILAFLKIKSVSFYVYMFISAYFFVYLMLLLKIQNAEKVSKQKLFSLIINRLNLALIILFIFFI
ncbi:MAG: UbiA family prenyltransferase [bacterium]